jgi:hypothetical protein
VNLSGISDNLRGYHAKTKICTLYIFCNNVKKNNRSFIHYTMTITLAEVVFGLIAIVAAIVLLVIGAIERESSSPYEFHYFQPWHSDAAFTFIGGNYTSSDVMVTDVFQVHRANWSVRLTAYKVRVVSHS